jgi:hypothetical protein
MKIPVVTRRSAICCAWLIALAACSGSEGSQSSAPSGLTPIGRYVPFIPDRNFPGFTGVIPRPMKPDHHKSWISPDVKRAPRILFVTDYALGDVYMFSMPSLTLEGTLTGFSGPQGACTDGSNIWIANTNTSQVFKYSRTGSLLATLDDPGELPVGCSVNRSNGDVVVSNIITVYGEAGNLELFQHGSGTGMPLKADPYMYEYFFPVYDPKGNIFINSISTSFSYVVAECPAGSTYCHLINVAGPYLNFPGGLNWDRVNNQLVLGDQECGGGMLSCWYAATVSGSTATITGTTTFTNSDGSACDIDQGALSPFSKYAAGGCSTSASSMSTVDRWPYPAGGSAATYNTSVDEPVGAAISNK